MASMNDIKRRKSSVESTQQITKAMKLVSTVKLQHAKKDAEEAGEYFKGMYETVNSLVSKIIGNKSPYINGNNGSKKAVIVLSSNKGLAGGYNSLISKLIIESELDKNNTSLYTIGSKGRDALKSKGYEIKKDYKDIGEKPNYTDAINISREIISEFKNEEFSEIYLAYTYFKNTVTHIPTLIKLLPIVSTDNNKEDEEKSKIPMEFDMDEDEALELLVPKYMASQIFGAMVQSLASENGARMQAMDSATSNAEEMISTLSLLYNRARQSSITQELTEIIAGADAIG